MLDQLREEIKIGNYKLPVWALGIGGGLLLFVLLGLRGGGEKRSTQNLESAPPKQSQGEYDKLAKQVSASQASMQSALQDVQAQQAGIISGVSTALRAQQEQSARALSDYARAQAAERASMQNALRALADQFNQLSRAQSPAAASQPSLAIPSQPVQSIYPSPSPTPQIQRSINPLPTLGVASGSVGSSLGFAGADIGGGGGGSSGFGNTYTVVAGDTLSKIAHQSGMSLSQLLSLNPQITNPNLIRPGQTIQLAGGGGSSGFG